MPWTKNQLIADLQLQFIGVGTSLGNGIPENPGNEGPVNGVTKYIINVVEIGLSEANRKPTAYRKNITFYVLNDTITTPSSSVTSLAIGTGQKTLTIGTGREYLPGQPIDIINDSTHNMYGMIISYNPTTGIMIVNVLTVVGAGTFTSWTISPPEVAFYERAEPTNTSETDVTITTSSYLAIANLYNSKVLQARVLAAVMTQCAVVFNEGSGYANHATRMKLVSLANQNLSLVVMEFMCAVALNTAVQIAGTAVADSTLQSIVSGAWDSYAGLIADFVINGGL
jgi:hypothetical protein